MFIAIATGRPLLAVGETVIVIATVTATMGGRTGGAPGAGVLAGRDGRDCRTGSATCTDLGNGPLAAAEEQWGEG